MVSAFLTFTIVLTGLLLKLTIHQRFIALLNVTNRHIYFVGQQVVAKVHWHREAVAHLLAEQIITFYLFHSKKIKNKKATKINTK